MEEKKRKIRHQLDSAMEKLAVDLKAGRLNPSLLRLLYDLIGHHYYAYKDLKWELTKILRKQKPSNPQEAEALLKIGLEAHEIGLINDCLYAINTNPDCYIQLKDDRCHYKLLIDIGLFDAAFWEIEEKLLNPLFNIFEEHAHSSRDNHQLALTIGSKLSREDFLEISKKYGKILLKFHSHINTNLDDFALIQARDYLNALQYLWIEGETDFSSKTIAETAEVLPLLKNIKLHTIPLENIDLRNCPSLEALEFSRVSGLEIIHLRNLPRLERLDIYSCPELKEVHLSEITNLREAQMSYCKNLKKIIVEKQPPSGVFCIKKCTNYHPDK